MEDGEALATGRADDTLESGAPVADAGFAGVIDEAEAVGEVAASDAEDRTLGQKLSLHVCISVGEYCQK